MTKLKFFAVIILSGLSLVFWLPQTEDIGKANPLGEHIPITSHRAVTRKPPPSTGTNSNNVILGDYQLASVATPFASSAIGKQTSIHFITVQTRKSPAWCKMLLSAAASNITVHTLAWGEHYEHSKRPDWILQFVAKLSDDDVVVFTDATDVEYGRISPQEIINRFLAMKMGLVFNAEANCYLQQAFDGPWGVTKAKCIAAFRRTFPNRTSKWRYLNAGAWIGSVWAVKKFFRAVIAHIKVMSAKTKVWCDQSMIGMLLLSGRHSHYVGIDDSNRIFLATLYLDVKHDFCPLGSLTLCPAAPEPAILHFNGKSKDDIRMYFSSRLTDHRKSAKNLNEHVTFINGKESLLKDTCKF
eukprot:PhF_6_TR5262/c0_g1_i1/m.7648